MQRQGSGLNFSKTSFFHLLNTHLPLCFHGTAEVRKVLLFHKTVKSMFNL
jgi:hypothetical protein